MEKADLELGLKVADRVTKRRLLHPQALCGPRKMQFFRNSNEMPKVAQFHSHLPKLRAKRRSDANLLAPCTRARRLTICSSISRY